MGAFAYPNPLFHVVSCDSLEHYKKYDEDGDETSVGCNTIDEKTWFEIRQVLPQEKYKYIVAISDAKSHRPAGYVGAGDLSPFIPAGTELDVMNASNDTDEDPSQTVPELVDQKQQKIGELLDHTRVRVRGIFPDSPTTYIAVTVLTGSLQNREGYIDLDDLNALTGDDELDSFVGSTADTVAESTPSPEPLVPTRDEITEAVGAVFNRKTATPGPSMPPVFTPALVRSERGARRIMEVVCADDVTSRVDDVRGPSADVTESYTLTSDKKAKLHFVRHDTWTFVHGSGRWLLDTVLVRDKILQSVEVPGGAVEAISDSRYDAGSDRVLFTLDGVQFAWISQKDLGWKVSPLTTPAPVSQLPPVQGATANQGSSGYVSDPPAAADPYADCSSESIESVSEDGAVIKLLDGRRFLINDSERYMTSIWLATDDVTVCDRGPGQSAKLIHEDDVVYGGHLQ